MSLTVFSLLSLLGAYILFKSFKASAFIETCTCFPSEAISGFVARSGTFSRSYYKIASPGLPIRGEVGLKLPDIRVVLGVGKGHAF